MILFLQKFNEPPKRTDMVIDSVEAILSKADIEGWEDESILRGYLKKIGVKKDTYNEFLSKSEDYDFWETNNYFGKHYNEFVNSLKYAKKGKQKTFQKLSVSEQKKWFNQKFYEYAFSVEQEKLFYYSLVYNQDTLIISAPDENKEQKKFLGYKWSNRKGQEGIQIIKAGGCLYNASDRSDNNSIAGLIRNAFSDEDKFDVEELDTYYYRLRLRDMLDFSGTTFNKSIKTTPTRVLKDIPGLTNYRLSDKNFFDLNIGNRVLSNEVNENGSTPIYSANVFEEFGRIDKQNITDFSMPSIIWGIDGDWMVNIIPANKPFYPTDHCGVLHIKTDDIVPKYMALALQVEGEYERFSRSNRASTQRISNLIIQVPSVTDQQKIVDEIEAIDKQIAAEQAIITEQSEKVKSKFVEMFGDIPENNLLSDFCAIEKGSNITSDEVVDGQIPVVAGGINPSCYHNKSNREADIITVSASGANAGYLNYWSVPIFASDCNTIQSLDKKRLSNIYLYHCLLERQGYIYTLQKGSGQPHVYGKDLEKIKIAVPPITLQNEFANYVETCDKLKFEARERLGELNTAREELIDKYFR